MQATMGGERVPVMGAGGTGTAGGAEVKRARRWRRTLAGYTANVTTYVADHVVPARRRARPALAAESVVPPATVARTAVERDGRWPVHVATAVARILVAIDWALPGGSGSRAARGYE